MQEKAKQKHRLFPFLCPCRLMLLLSAWLRLIPYLSSATAAVRPWSFRYLIGLMVSLPAVIAPLIPSRDQVTSVKLKMKTYIGWGAIALILAANIAGTLHNFSLLSQGTVRVQRQKELVP